MGYQIRTQSHLKEQAIVKVTVVIPNLNSPIVDGTISSILNQKTDDPFEIIVVGIDKYNLVDKYQDQVKIVTTDNPVFPGTARNIGASLAKGEILIFIDSDTIASQGLINAHVTAHEGGEGSRIIGGSIDFDNKHYLRLSDNVSTFHEFMRHTKDGIRKQVPSANMSITKELFNQLGGFYEKAIGEDSEFCARAGIKKVKIIFASAASIQHFPNRKTLREILNHAYMFGNYTSRFDGRYRAYFNSPEILGKGLFLVMTAPILAALIIIKMITIESLPLKYWHTLPAVFLTKFVWCWGAAKKQFKERKELF